ncbi:MAG: hypothetical protein K5886_02930 [Lachnospiraceae bacterium]|nr:hypothetical protein [Lachnospiraceae bacterium]
MENIEIIEDYKIMKNAESTKKPKNMNSRAEKAAFILLTLAVILFGIWYLTGLLSLKHSEKMYRYFMESDQSYDVLFFGSSHMKNALSPNDIYHEYGIRGYNLSMQGNYLDSNYYLIKECLHILDKTGREYPKIIVMDTFDAVQEPGNLHNAWDSFPLDKIKLEMIRELTDKDHRWGFYFPFSLYHNRWNDIQITDYRIPYNDILGIEPGYEIYDFETPWEIPEAGSKKEVPQELLDKFDRIKDLCDEKGIKLILCYIPDRIDSSVLEAESIGEYAAGRGIEYINFAYEDTGLDYDLDFFDPDGHLNIRGARKFSFVMGEKLKEYGLPDRRGDENSEVWDDYYRIYLEDAKKRIEEAADPDPYIAEAYKGEISLTDEPEAE